MKCPYCDKDETSVVDSREAEDKASIRRRRNCTHCGKRFTTYERVEGIDLKVLKIFSKTSIVAVLPLPKFPIINKPLSKLGSDNFERFLQEKKLSSSMK